MEASALRQRTKEYEGTVMVSAIQLSYRTRDHISDQSWQRLAMPTLFMDLVVQQSNILLRKVSDMCIMGF